MTQEIIEMANEAGCISYTKPHIRAVAGVSMTFAQLEAFAKLVDAKATAREREACAKMFDGAVWAYDYREIAAAIRARGEA